MLDTTITAASTSERQETALLKTAIVDSANPNNADVSVQGRLLFDDGSTKSYITRDLCDRLKLEPLHTKTLIINGACNQSTTTKCAVVQLNVLTLDRTPITITASVLNSICHPLQTQHLNTATSQYKHLKSIILADSQGDDDTPKSIDILVGADHYYNFMPQNAEMKRSATEKAPVAILTKVGWVLSGPISSSNRINSTQLAVEHTLQTSESNAYNIQKMWDLETIGITPADETYETFANNLEFQDGHYRVRLPWKQAHAPLPDNYNNSLRRLRSNLKRLKANPEILTQYSDTLTSQHQDGIIERRFGGEPIEEKLHYLPHHSVVRADKQTTKLRIVYDASSKPSKNLPSINECLTQGPSLNPLLFDILIRFRVNPTAFICDIVKGFLQIHIDEHDRDALRFLWVDDPLAADPEIIIYRFTRVLFGLNCSPFLFNATLREHFGKYLNEHEAHVESIMRSLYVDDYTGGACDTDHAHEIYKLMKSILKLGGFDIHKFVTNDSDLSQRVSLDDTTPIENSESYADRTLGNTSEKTKVLGVPWCNASDELIIEFTHVTQSADETTTPTKRSLLSTLAKLYDPLGFVSPVAMQAKMIFQEACRREIGWDDPLPHDLSSKFQSWLATLKSALKFSIPRCYALNSIAQLMLVGFSDASQVGYAAVIYLRATLDSGLVTTMLVASKARIAPLKGEKMTIPRLELLGCLILARLMEKVKQALESSLLETRFYSDSTINLHRIKGRQREYKQFVENRLAEIRTKSSHDSWYFVPGELNPSDLPSRGGDATNLNDKWVKGPIFIQQPEIEIFPLQQREDEVDHEMKSTTLIHEQMPISNAGYIPSEYFTKLKCQRLDTIINIENFSNLSKLLRVTAYVMRFISRSHHKGELTANEIKGAGLAWARSEQKRFAQEQPHQFKKTANNLRLLLDHTMVVRCRGRLAKSSLPFNQKHPIFIPQSTLARLLVLDAHEEVFHQKTRPTLTQVRANYWIPRGRQFVTSTLKSCNLCRRLDAHPYQLPAPPNLPDFRVEIAPAFTNVGTDHVGPIYVQEIYSNTRRLHKCYISVYSCCVTRAVHIELQPSLKAAATIRSMKRTFARVGTPKLIVSDNHKTFKSASVRAYARNRMIEWRNILPLSPHWGGFYERINSIIKRALRSSLRNTHVNYEEMETLLIEIEAIINSRPLCYVYEDEVAEPLTPSHLIYGRRLKGKDIQPNNQIRPDDNSPSKRVRYLDGLLNNFWERFKSEYLTNLQERDVGPANPNVNLKVGDIVLIKEDNVARMEWVMGRVLRLVTSEDGITRGAVLQTKDGTRKRPVTKLCPFEIQPEDANDTIDSSNDSNSIINNSNISNSDRSNANNSDINNSTSTHARTRPIRDAAVAGQLNRRFKMEVEEEEDF